MATGRILIVDGNRPVREQLTVILNPLASYVQPADSLQAGISALQIGMFDVVFSEFHFHDGDGARLFHETSRRSPRPWLVGLTGTTSPDQLIDGFRAGLDDCLLKPLHEAAVVAAWERRGARPTMASTTTNRSETASAAAPAPRQDAQHLTITVPLTGDFDRIERLLVEETIVRFGGNKAAAAKALGMHRRTLYRVLSRGTATEPI